MKIGINRKIENFQIHDKEFNIAIVPVHAHYLTVEHDKNEGDFDKQVSLIYEVVSDILEANGYEFEKEFWEKYLDYKGFVEFVAACLIKDVVPDKKKARKEVSKK
jgi:hypothetical protein